MFVMQAKNLQLIGILLLDNPQYPWEDELHPYVPCFCPLRLAMHEQSGVLQVKLRHCELKAFGKVLNHIFLDYGFEVLIGVRMEASMSKIDQEG
jgi:hypothetical protein